MGALGLTRGMIEDFVWDPVLASSIIFPDLRLDVFQRVRLKMFWYVPELMDSSAVGTGKTVVDWLYINLRALLLTNLGAPHTAGVFYPAFGTGKKSFWTYYRKRECRSPMFNAQCGKCDAADTDETDASSSQPDCWYWRFRYGGEVQMPAPSVQREMATLKSARYDTVLVEEYVDYDKQGQAIDLELAQRAIKASYASAHPIWANHIKYTAHAETSLHPSHQRYRGLVRAVERGEVDQGHITFSFKDWSARRCGTGKTFSEEYRPQQERNLARRRHRLNEAQMLGTYFGLWTASADGWYTEDLLKQAVEIGRRMLLEPMLGAKRV